MHRLRLAALALLLSLPASSPGQGKPAEGDRLAQRRGIEPRFGQRAPESQRRAGAALLRGHRVDDHVGDRNFVGADAVDAEQPQHGAFDRDRRMGGNERLDRRHDGGRQFTAAVDRDPIELQVHG